ncbi:MAG: hypothetical protein QOG63_504 [Thermoleophilaceae bacterium]|nr:hypothetical protein [Thermoleophilaceae bacterium]
MHRRLHIIFLAAIAALSLAVPATASAKKHVFHASQQADGTYVFDLGKLESQRLIKRATMSARGVSTSIKGRTMRNAVQHGKFQVAPFRVVGQTTSAASRTRARLVVRTVRRHRAPVNNGNTNTNTNSNGNGNGNGNGSRAVPTGSCGPGQTWKQGNWPGACWRPYADDSPFNLPIPSGAPTGDNSDGIVKQMTGYGPANTLTSHASGADDWAHPVYYSQPGDPEFKVHCVEDWGTCEPEGETVKIPDAARPASAGDAHLTVVDQASGWEYDFWQVRDKPGGGGKMVVSWAGKTRIDGDGLGSAGVAAGYGNLAGLIRAPELAAGKIDHALFLVVKCTSGKTVYPATGTGSVCSRIGVGTANAPAMGQRFQLDLSDSEIDGLNVPAWKKTVLHAMAKYGMYVGDTGGDAWGLQFESPATYQSFGFDDPFVAIGADNGLPTNGRDRIFDLNDGVNWERHLRVVAPCTAKGSC